MHHGSTYNSARMLLGKIAQEDTVINEFFLPADGPGFCIGCFACISKGEEFCPHAGKVQNVVEALYRSQIIIFGSPTYCLEMTGQLKTLFDHTGYMWLSHRPRSEMFSKIGIVLSTTAGTGAGSVTKSLSRQLFWWGVPKVYRLKFKVSASTWNEVSESIKDKIEQQTSLVAQKVVRNISKVSPGFKTKFLFGIMRKMQIKNYWNITDKNYWQEKGWIAARRPWQG